MELAMFVIIFVSVVAIVLALWYCECQIRGIK